MPTNGTRTAVRNSRKKIFIKPTSETISFQCSFCQVALDVGRTDPAANLNMKVVTPYHMDRSMVFIHSFI